MTGTIILDLMTPGVSSTKTLIGVFPIIKWVFFLLILIP